jgi:membrane fusion protein, multidrug efflux system
MAQERNSQALQPEELGRSFEAQSSPSFGADLGTSFEQHNSSREEYLKAKHRTRSRLLFIGGMVVLLAIVAVIYFTSKPKKAPAGQAGAAGGASGAATGGRSGGGGGRRGQQGPAAITVDNSTTGNINVYVDALGTVTPLNTVTVYSQITGRVIAVHYREGQLVSKGDPLVDIDPAPYQATLDQAEGTLEHDQGVLAEYKLDLSRYQSAGNAIARQTLEDQQQLVVQEEGTVKSDQANVEYDKVQLSYCHIVSPITGRVGLRLVDPGNTVFSGTGSTLVVVTQLAPITVVFNVSEDDLPQIETQLKSHKSLEVDAYDRADTKQIAKGTLSSLDNQIDTTTGTLKFRATFQNPGNGLTPNQFVNARLLVKTLQNVVLVPSAAVQQNGTQAFVYVVKPSAKNEKAGTVAVQNVTILTSNEKVNAVQGLAANTTMATSGFDRLEAGAQVQIQKVSSGAASTTSSTSTGATTP